MTVFFIWQAHKSSGWLNGNLIPPDCRLPNGNKGTQSEGLPHLKDCYLKSALILPIGGSRRSTNQMSENINKEAFKQAEKELLEEQVKQVKDYILETLKKIESKKKEKSKVEEELRVLKLNLDDLRNGRFDKLEERVEKSRLAREVSPILTNPLFNNLCNAINLNCTVTDANTWMTYTAGTYNTGLNTIYLSTN